MSSIKEHVARHRQSIRAVSLLGVLLASVGIAYLLVDYKSAGAKKGSAILSEIQRKGLGDFLPAAPSEDYYLITSAGRPTGWLLVYTKPGKNGGYSGGNIMMQKTSPGETEIYISQWELDKNAATGSYVSQVFLRDGLPNETFTTEITLDEKTVTLAQELDSAGMKAASPRPANYIPEDLRHFAYFLLIKQKTDACFKTIFDQIPSENSSVPFVTLRCRYAGEQDGLSRLAVRSSIDDSETPDSIYCFSREGKLLKVLHSGNTQEVLVTREKLEETFPNSMQVIKKLTK